MESQTSDIVLIMAAVISVLALIGVIALLKN
jgi:hypothetical protein